MTVLSYSTVAQTISDQFPFESKFLSISGHKMHYVDEGTGDPILLLHGVPMSSYSFRNIIPSLTANNRVIAIDFMGFGKSDKPDIDYSFGNQLAYLSSFIENLDLKNITLVMTDIGGIIGSNYAINHPERIKGLIFMEAPMGDAETFHKNGGFMQRMMFWMARKDKMGYNMFVRKNMFIRMMPMLIKRKLNNQEKEIYLSPFHSKESRIPLFSLPNAFPKKGKNAQNGDMAYFLNLNAEGLKKSDVPKLIIYATPGMLVNKKALEWAHDNLSNLASKYVGKAKHLIEEDLPFEIAKSIAEWQEKTH